MTAASIQGLVLGFRTTCILVAASKLGIIAQLQTPCTERELCARLDAHAPSLHRLLRMLMSLAVIELRDGKLALTEAGLELQGMGDLCTLIDEEYLPAWARLAGSVRDGKTAFDELFGMTVWEHRKQLPELSERLNRTMLGYQRERIDAILRAYDFSATKLLVDVGGNHGTDVCEILARHPGCRAILFDQPHVVASASANLAAAGMSDRVELAGGSFFEAVPAGGDTYLLKHVLHNWNDERSLQILRTCRKALDASARLLVIEELMPEDGAPWAGVESKLVWDTAMLDIHMMTVCGGVTRTLAEHDALYQAAGLRRTGLFDAELTHVVELRTT